MYKLGIKFELIFESDFVDEIAIVNKKNGLEFDIIDNS